MADEPLGKNRRKGGRPREIDEEMLRSQYGQAGVDLVVLLYSLADEAGFTNIAAARHWAENDPEGARKHNVLKDSGIQPRRLSEAVKMVNGPIPAGLVKTFLKLWAETLPAAAGSSRAQRVADQVTVLWRKVVVASERPSAFPTRSSRSAGAAAKTGKLKDELLRVQDDLIRTQQSETRFRNLSSVLFIALTQLRETHRRLVEERNELQARAESSRAVEAEARVAAEQLARAQRQLDEAKARTAEAEELAEDLRGRYAELYARLVESGAADAASTTASVADDTFRVGTTFGGGSLADSGATLDRVEDMLAEGVLDLTQTRDRLAHDDEQGDPWPKSDPDNPLTSINVLDNPAHNSTSDAAERGGQQAGWTTWPVPEPVSEEAAPEVQPQYANELISSAFVHLGGPSTGKIELVQSAHLAEPFRVAVVGLKGGVGSTTIALCLGALFAELRAEPVIAVDIAPHGNLDQRLLWETRAPLQDLVKYEHWITTHALVQMYTSRSASGLEVLASADYTERDYRDTLRLLERFYGIVITDCGPSLTSPAMSAVLEQADVLLVATSCSRDAAQTSVDTLKWLDALGYGHLLPRIVVLNQINNTAGRIDVDELKSHLVSLGHTLICVPDDPHLADGTAIEPDKLTADTRTALLDLAVGLAKLFPAAHSMRVAKTVLASAVTTAQGPPDDADTRSTVPIASPLRSWKDELRLLDGQLVKGEISADEYRRRRDAALGKR